MGDYQVQMLREKLQQQKARLDELQSFREMGKRPLPAEDLYQFPVPDSKLSATQLHELSRLLQSRLHSATLHTQRLADSLSTEKQRTSYHRAVISSLERAANSHCEEIGYSGKCGEMVELAERGKAARVWEKDIERVKGEIARANAMEKQWELRLQTETAIAQGLEAAEDYIARNRSDYENALELQSQLLQEVEEIRLYLQTTSDKSQLIADLETRQNALRAQYQEVQNRRYSAENRHRMLVRDCAELHQLQQKLYAVTAENSQLRNSLRTAITESLEIEASNHLLERDIAKSEDFTTEVCDTPRFVAEERSSIESAMEFLSGKLRSLQQDLIQKRSDYKRLKQKLWEIDKENSDLQAKYALVVESRDRTVCEIASVRDKAEKTEKGAIEENIGAELTVNQLKSALESGGRKGEMLKSDLSESRLLLHSLQSELSASKAAVEGLPAALKSEARLRAEVAKVLTAITEAKAEAANIAQAVTELQRLAQDRG